MYFEGIKIYDKYFKIDIKYLKIRECQHNCYNKILEWNLSLTKPFFPVIFQIGLQLVYLPGAEETLGVQQQYSSTFT